MKAPNFLPKIAASPDPELRASQYCQVIRISTNKSASRSLSPVPGGEPDIVLDFAGPGGARKTKPRTNTLPCVAATPSPPHQEPSRVLWERKRENKNSNALGFITVSEMQSISFSASGHFFFPPAGLTFDKCWAVCGRASGGERWCIGMERLQDKQPVI